jgi:transcriptional regulator
MYVPPHFAEQRPDVLHQFIRDHPFATVISATPDGFAGSHVPLVLHQEPGAPAVLRGHFSRANPQSRDQVPERTLSIFHGPDAYISPSWYPTKLDSGRVVPTWNFIVVHVEGLLRIVDDGDFLERHLRLLTEMHERGRPQPWAIEDAPRDYLDSAMKRIVAFEIVIGRMEGKWKLSQNRNAADRAGVVRGLQEDGDQVMSERIRSSRHQCAETLARGFARVLAKADAARQGARWTATLSLECCRRWRRAAWRTCWGTVPTPNSCGNA